MQAPLLALVGLAALAAGLSAQSDSRPSNGCVEIDPPAGAGSLAPVLSLVGDAAVILSWLEPVEGKEHALRFARFDGSRWTEPTTVVQGGEFFVNWADCPSVVATGKGDVMLAHWLQRSGKGTYAYDVRLARSTDGGGTWHRLGAVHDDGTETEHGFVTIVPAGAGFDVIWLDGRAMAVDGGTMSLRAARIDAGADDGLVVDPDVCTCCQTDAVALPDGSVLAVYRDHELGEIRDISIVRRSAEGGWSAPRAVHDDGWRMPGCPVNGPAIATAGERVAVAWFTAAEDRARVQVARSIDGGESFAAPVVLDAATPLGRVDVVGVRDGFVVSWLAQGDQVASLTLCHVNEAGDCGEPRVVATMGVARSSGFPRVACLGEDLLLAWRDTADAPQLRAVLLPVAELPRAVR